MVRWRWIAAVIVGWVAFAYRFPDPYFHNDHFEHLSMARQVQFGDLPVRDFFDPGRPLTIGLSAIAQQVGGASLLSEAVLTIGALAIGTAITFWLASKAARSLVIGALAASLVIAMAPRLYSYPKILVFPIALWALWRYFDSPTRAGLMTLAAATAFAFLMRHDFGVYVGLVSLLMILAVPHQAGSDSALRTPHSALRTWHSALHTLVAFALTTTLLVSPYLWWLAHNDRLLGSGTSGVGSLLDAPALSWPSPHLDFSRPLVLLSDIRVPVKVRWQTGLTPDTRAGLERRYGLIDGHSDDNVTFSYTLADDSPDNLRALVNDAQVQDTSGIDRGRSAVTAPWWDRLGRRLGIGCIVWGPMTPQGAEAWIYYVFWAIPIAALLYLTLRRNPAGQERVRSATFGVRSASSTQHQALSTPNLEFSHEALKISTAALLGVVLNLYLIRGSLDSRLPDVVVPAAIVGAWLLRAYVDWIRRTRRAVGRIAQSVALTHVVLLMSIAVTAYEPTAGIGRLATAAMRVKPIHAAAHDLARKPLDRWSAPESTGVRRLTRYIHDCTTPEDRLLLVAYEPEVFYYSERLFAGGMPYFHQRRFSSERDQSEIVERLQRQQVPLVIVDDSRSQLFEDDYANVFRYVQTRYEEVGASTFGENQRRWRIFTDRQRPPRATTFDGLPCYR